MFFRSLLEKCHFQVFVLDADGVVTYANSAGSELTGYGTAGLRNAGFMKFVCPKDILVFSKALKTVLASPGAEIATEFDLLLHDEKTLAMDARIVNMLDDPCVRGIVIYAGSASARKSAEKELDRALTEAQEARKSAAEASETRNRFIAGMSHELRTPLNAVIGFCEMMKKTALDENQKELLEHIEFGGKCLYTLIADILEYAQLDSGNTSLNFSEFDLEKLVRDIVALPKTQAARKKVHLAFTSGYNPGRMLRGDANKLTQVLFHLLSNAVKFTEKGHIIVKTELAGETAGNVNVKFSVIDEGKGIDENMLASIFEPFVQAAGPSGTGPGGTGLGLTIANRLVKQMGGTGIAVESRENFGSVFSFTVPLLTGALPASAAGESDSSYSAAAPQKYNLLVVEDNYLNGMLIKKLLRRAGHEVTVAVNGYEALTFIETGGFDLILLDLQMPVMDGFETARKLRERSIAVPVIAVTASATREDYEACRALGMRGFLTKPLNISELEAVIAKVMGEGWRAGEIAVSDKIAVRSLESKPRAGSVTFNKKALFENMGGVDELIKDSLFLFMKYAPHNLENIGQAVETGDPVKLKNFSHSMKSTARSVGAEIMADLLYGLEKCGAEGRIDESARAMYKDLAAQYDEFIKTLDAEGLAC